MRFSRGHAPGVVLKVYCRRCRHRRAQGSLQPDVGVPSIYRASFLRTRVLSRSVYKKLMDKPAKHCKIVYVRRSQASGWAWQPISPEVEAKPSVDLYALFYECVVAARACGYTLATPLKCS